MAKTKAQGKTTVSSLEDADIIRTPEGRKAKLKQRHKTRTPYPLRRKVSVLPMFLVNLLNLWGVVMTRFSLWLLIPKNVPMRVISSHTAKRFISTKPSCPWTYSKMVTVLCGYLTSRGGSGH